LVTKTRHPLTNAEYSAESKNTVRVVDGDKSGLFDRFGEWIEGDLRQCDPHMCIWLTGLFVVKERNDTTARISAAGAK
jgi:hypothetical protein